MKDCKDVYAMICDLENIEFDRTRFEEVFINNLNTPGIHYFIAEYNNAPAGFISLSIQYHLHHAGKIGEIVEFYINPSLRSLGLGKQIIKEVEKTAIENGCILIELASNKKRERAHKFYERENYVSTHFKFVKKFN
jgi:PhnO protein